MRMLIVSVRSRTIYFWKICLKSTLNADDKKIWNMCIISSWSAISPQQFRINDTMIKSTKFVPSHPYKKFWFHRHHSLNYRFPISEDTQDAVLLSMFIIILVSVEKLYITKYTHAPASSSYHTQQAGWVFPVIISWN